MFRKLLRRSTPRKGFPSPWPSSRGRGDFGCLSKIGLIEVQPRFRKNGRTCRMNKKNACQSLGRLAGSEMGRMGCKIFDFFIRRDRAISNKCQQIEGGDPPFDYLTLFNPTGYEHMRYFLEVFASITGAYRRYKIPSPEAKNRLNLGSVRPRFRKKRLAKLFA